MKSTSEKPIRNPEEHMKWLLREGIRTAVGYAIDIFDSFELAMNNHFVKDAKEVIGQKYPEVFTREFYFGDEGEEIEDDGTGVGED